MGCPQIVITSRSRLGLAVFAVVIAPLLAGSCGGNDATEPITTTAVSSAISVATSDQTKVISLEVDGLGVVTFGQPADDVRAELERIIGSPPTDPWLAADWVQFVGWQDLGLYVGFDTPVAADFTGASRFVGWDQVEPAGSRGMTTAEGIGVGTTLADLRTTYGNRLEVIDEPDECTGGWLVRITSSSGGDGTVILGSLDDTPSDDAQLTTLHAGVGVGC